MQMLLLCCFMAVINSMVFMPALVAIFGPTKIVRTRRSMLGFFSGFVLFMGIVVLFLWSTKLPMRWPNGSLVFYRTDLDNYDSALYVANITQR